MATRTERKVVARYRWDSLKVSFWFAPTLMALGAVLLAWGMYWLDNLIPNAALQDSRFILAGTVGELRSALLSIATTVLATAGVFFTSLFLAWADLQYITQSYQISQAQEIQKKKLLRSGRRAGSFIELRGML